MKLRKARKKKVMGGLRKGTAIQLDSWTVGQLDSWTVGQ